MFSIPHKTCRLSTQFVNIIKHVEPPENEFEQNLHFIDESFYAGIQDFMLTKISLTGSSTVT